MIKILLIGTGGFLGSIFRFIISGLVHRWLENAWFPFGTLTVNILGCLIIGFLGGLIELRQVLNPELRVFIMIGLLGGFTTFSTFGFESYNLARDGQWFATFTSIGLHLILVIWVGHILSRLF
ncbi:MAG: fluoride efflux transporter CrcB [Candidatus Hodarchaeales archaeon]|jgi:CrcB protein